MSKRTWWGGVFLVASVSALVLTGAARPGVDGVAPEAPTFAQDVAPILYESCAGCHRPLGSAPFALLTYEDARDHADRIARATSARVMPPWLPNTDGETFLGERRLTEDQIRTLREWADAGAPEGDPATAPTPPPDPGAWPLGPPDLVVQVPEYALEADGPDVYRNLVVTIPVEETRWVAAVELNPGNRRVVHHARMMVDTTGSSRALDLADDEAGFDGIMLRSAASNPSGHFVGWTPGKVQLPPQADMAWRLDPGTDLVLQLHLRKSGEPERVQAEVGFYFADEPPAKSPVVLLVSQLMIDIPAGESDYRVTNSYTLPVDVDVLSVYPHAHYLGDHLQGFAWLPDGKSVELIDIPDWDFNWQDDYRFREPVHLPAGTVIAMDFTFDNTAANPHNPADPPVRVRYGSNSADEMADLILQVLPRNPEDRERLVIDHAWKNEADDMAYMAFREYTDGRELLAAGSVDEAIPHFQEALQFRADHTGALVALSRAFVEKGDGASALIIARQAVQLTSRRDAHALDALARAHFLSGEKEDAISTAEEALSVARSSGDRIFADSVSTRVREFRSGGSGGAGGS